MSHDRITRNGELYGPGDPTAVDEVVHTGWMHLEMLDHHAAYLALYRADATEQTMLRLVARPMTRAERRHARRVDQTRRRDLLAQLVGHPPRVSWSVPWWRRPWALWRQWRDETPTTMLEVRVDEDGLGLADDTPGQVT